jgi:shikimate kinase
VSDGKEEDGFQHMNVILIGYRATGKTSVALELSQRLGIPWFDSDQVVEQRAGKTIARIFQDDGEPVFRDLEVEAIADLLLSEEPVILSTGGGAPMRPETQSLLRKSGTVVWLTASPETILERIGGDQSSAETRPSLTQLSPAAEIEHMLERRSPVYRETSHLEIATDGRTVARIAEEIAEELARRCDGNALP